MAVLPWLNVNTIQSYGELLKCRSMQNGDDTSKDANFIMLQLVNALKVLQAQGVEELPQSLSCFVLCREMDKDTNNKLYVLQGYVCAVVSAVYVYTQLLVQKLQFIFLA